MRKFSLVFSLGVAAGALSALLPAQSLAQNLNLSQAPLFLVSSVRPNVLVLYDNSESMDGTMAGKLIAGDDPTTRGNIARAVLSSTMTSYRSAFNWGLGSFELNGSPNVYYTYGYFFGSDQQVLFTDDCVGGVSNTNRGLRCIPNPEPFAGGRFITYYLSGDDPAINDVLYIGGDYGPQLYGNGVYGSTSYDVFINRNGNAGTSWDNNSFNAYQGQWGFTPTDAGYLPTTPPSNRMLWVKRAWGYYNDITGAGRINLPVAADSTSQHDALMALLAPETGNPGSADLKNAAVFTPLAGTLDTARRYFANTLGNGTNTPISQSCQKNFVLLATDGNPTGNTDGNMYSLEDQQNTYARNAWTFSPAANDVFDNIRALRTTNLRGRGSLNGPYDVQTYVVGLGDTLANASSIAALNRMALLGGGSPTAYLADDATALGNAFQQISADIISKTSAASAVSLNSGSWNTGSQVFQARFSSGDWSGQLLAYRLDASGTPRAPTIWDSGQLLNAQDWNTGRRLFTYKPSAALNSRGIALRWPANSAAPTATEMDSAMVLALNTSPSGAVDNLGSDRLDYLRGDTSREGRNCSSCATAFRNRPTSVLGDIVNSAPVYVGGATGNFRDTIERASYSAYSAARSGGTPAIFVGANDGLLHAFNGSTGSELFAYAPWAIRNKLSGLTGASYAHQYTVDGSPTVGDAYYGGQWHTALVSGMNAGAPGLFALDVGNLQNLTEADATRIVRWEIDGSDADVGYVFSQPVIAKMRNNRWMAIVGNGYNSTSKRAVLLLVDIETGALTRINTLAGGSSAGNGLSGVVAISSANNGVADIVYAGDLLGNLWRFDVSSVNPAAWKVAYGSAGAPLPVFTTAAGQAITARPDVTLSPQGGYLLSFGTGRYVDSSDNGTSTPQAVYGIWDNGISPTTIGQLQSQSVFDTAAGTNGKTYRVTTHAVGAAADGVLVGDNAVSLAAYYATKRGWVLNLPLSGERVVAQATIRFGKVVVSTLIPDTSPCSYGGDGWIMEVDVITGNRGDISLDTNGDNSVDSLDRVVVRSVATGGKVVSGVRVGSIPAAAAIIRSQDRTLDDKLINTSSGSVLGVRESGNGTRSARAAWEQIR
ncbi:MAG: PilC/PilY family type IV pilus protein [Pseudomonadota bacterium]|nr:PilC/PilY family type IV pilus protein [Pseudomonadota bacterium]